MEKGQKLYEACSQSCKVLASLMKIQCDDEDDRDDSDVGSSARSVTLDFMSKKRRKSSKKAKKRGCTESQVLQARPISLTESPPVEVYFYSI